MGSRTTETRKGERLKLVHAGVERNHWRWGTKAVPEREKLLINRVRMALVRTLHAARVGQAAVVERRAIGVDRRVREGGLHHLHVFAEEALRGLLIEGEPIAELLFLSVRSNTGCETACRLSLEGRELSL